MSFGAGFPFQRVVRGGRMRPGSKKQFFYDRLTFEHGNATSAKVQLDMS